MFRFGDWVWSVEHRQACRVVEASHLWGDVTYRVWLPDRDKAIRVGADALSSLEEQGAPTQAWIAYLAAAGRVADALSQDAILAPIEASVIPLPHQIRAVTRAVSNDRVRYLLADEVGLGKTIEAGLIMRELKLRGMVCRTLVVAPKGLVTQWVAEMHTHFSEDFRLFLPGDFSAFRRLAQEDNVWKSFDQVVCPMDSVKPMDARRGWPTERVARHNRERFDDLLAAGWDLIIIDEAHRVGGSTQEVARHRLGLGLSEAAPYLLLLSATPHQGKTDAFRRLMSLLSQDAFPDSESITKDRIHPYVIRTEKRWAIDPEGRPLFKPRTTSLTAITWDGRHRPQQVLYEAVTEYVREGYNQAIQEKKSYIGFLMLLMQRLVTSSTRAIRRALERRLEVLQEPDEQLGLFPEVSDEEWADLDGQEQAETLLTSRLKALGNERAEVRLLLETAQRAEHAGLDAKAEALLDWIYRLQQEEGDPDLKVLVFTEFVPTQEMLAEFLTERGFSVVCLNGSMGMEERVKVEKAFAGPARILVSTDAGGEGLNLQFCHVVVNYDIPWNPMRLEQRIGRVDRIGQEHPVRAVNFAIRETVEHRVREVLEEKLAVILEEFGVDKTGDILDSAQAGELFDDLYVEAILRPEDLDQTAEAVVDRVRETGQTAQERTAVLGDSEPLDAAEAMSLLNHPLPHWVERMTVSYLEACGGQVRRDGRGWEIVWPGEDTPSLVVFDLKDAQRVPAAHHLTLEDPRVRELASGLPRFAPGLPVPSIVLDGLPAAVRGIWALWRVSLCTPVSKRDRVLVLFTHEDGRSLAPTARFIWDELLGTEGVGEPGHLAPEVSAASFEKARMAALEQGKAVFEELTRAHGAQLERDQEKGKFAFDSRRRAIGRVGLPAMREYRLKHLAEEEHEWKERMERNAQVSPELVPIVVLHVEGAASHG